MKLIHCADLHLDSPMESNFPVEKAKERRGEVLSTFRRLIDLADRCGAAGILIAGDLFDSSRTTRRTERFVLDLITQHPNLYFFYLSGNHDSGNRWLAGLDKPKNLCTFGEDWTSYPFGDVTVIGSESPDPDTLKTDPDRVNILLLHGQWKRGAGAPAGDVIPMAKYRNRNLDYLALGHIHSYGEAKLDDRCVACYSGCLEGRGFDECGQKGYVLLEIEHGKVSHRFVPLARRTLHDISCDVSGCDSQTAIEDRVAEQVAGISTDDLLRLTLVGAHPVDLDPDLPRLLRLFSERFYFVKVYNKTRLLIRPEDYALDISLKGEFVRRVLADEKLTDEQKEKIIVYGIRALAGEEAD